MNSHELLDPKAIRILAEEDTKIALGKAEKKKLEMTGSYAKRLKDDNFVEINPDKHDLISQGTR